MINFNKRNVNILSFLVSSIIFICIVLPLNYSEKYSDSNIVENNLFNKLEEQTSGEIELNEIKKWNLEIKSLSIKGPISEMEQDEPEEAYIGHFKQTSILGNNVALIAYNFGKSTNYFANLKELKIGDEIIYTVNDTVKKYKVLSNQIIEKENLNYILDENNSGEDTLKLFTYVKDLDTKLRYICAK